jgi:LmbE family N-acetylglucosaminyl deacetylase
LDPTFRPNTFVDISRTLQAKIDALCCYQSEIRPFPHPRSPEAIEAIARRWGSVAGLPAAEAFQLIRAIRPGKREP